MRSKSLFFVFFAVMLLFSCNLMADGTLPDGAGTSEDPYQIETLNNLLWLSTTTSSLSGYFIQTADIDASETIDWNGGEGFIPIGIYPNNFHGHYDGQNHVIEGLVINRPNNVNDQGLFGAPYSADISNLGLIDVTVVGLCYVGGIAGDASKTNISNCFVTGSVTGDEEIGGFVGQITGFVGESYFIEDCYSRCTVIGEDFSIGGFAGDHFRTWIKRCYTTENVTGGIDTGAFIGYSGPTTGDHRLNNYWNETNAAGMTGVGSGPTGGVSGLTTAEMQTESSFIGWDFDTVWHIDENINDGYPHFRWDYFAVRQIESVPQDNQSVIQFDNVDTEIQFTSGHDATDIDIRMFTWDPNVIGELPAGCDNIADKYWRVTPSVAPGGTYSITFDLTGVNGIESFNTLKFLKRDDDESAWQDVQASATLVYNEAEITVTIQGLTSFSEFVPAGGEDNTLPVTLSSFTAVYNGDQPIIQWITCSEQQNSGWNVYRNSEEKSIAPLLN